MTLKQVSKSNADSDQGQQIDSNIVQDVLSQSKKSSNDPNELLIESLKPLKERRKKLEKEHELVKYYPTQSGLVEKSTSAFDNLRLKGIPVQFSAIEAVLDKYDENTINDQTGEQVNRKTIKNASLTPTPGSGDYDSTPGNQSSSFELVKVFPYLMRLHIEATSVTQHSLIEILEKQPYNDLFDAQSLIDQYSQICQISDETIIALAKSKYLRNIQVLDLSKAEYSCDSIQQLINSPNCVNIVELRLNCRNLNESVFISLAQSKTFPKLQSIKPSNFQNCYYSLGYLARAKYFDLGFDLEQSTLLTTKIIYQSNKFINNLISSIYMSTVRELHLDNMNDHMPALKEFFQLAKHCHNLEVIRLRNIADKAKYFFTWQELADSRCFPNLRSIYIDRIKFTENLNVLLQQKHKPLLDLNDIIQSEELIDNSTIYTLAKQPILLNSTNLSLQKLKHISKASWNELASSPYCFNIRSIDVAFDSLGNEIEEVPEENEHSIAASSNMYFNAIGSEQQQRNPLSQRSPHSRRRATKVHQLHLKQQKDQSDKEEALNSQLAPFRKIEILIRSNLVNLEHLSIQGCDEFSIEDIEALLESEAKGKISIRFDYINLLNQLAEHHAHPNVSSSDSSEELREHLSTDGFIERVVRKYRFAPLKQLNVSFFSLLDHKKQSGKLSPIEAALAQMQIEFVTHLEIDQSPEIMSWLFDQSLLSRMSNLKAINMKSLTKRFEYQINNNNDATTASFSSKEQAAAETRKQEAIGFQQKVQYALLQALKMNRDLGLSFDSTQFLMSLYSNGFDLKFINELGGQNLFAQTGNELIHILLTEKIAEKIKILANTLPSVLKNALYIYVHVLDASKKAFDSFMDEFIKVLPNIPQLRINDFKIIVPSNQNNQSNASGGTIISNNNAVTQGISNSNISNNNINSIKMSPSHFYQLCEYKVFSEFFPLMDFISDSMDQNSMYFAQKSPGFVQMTKLPCYLASSHLIIANINLDYIQLTPDCEDCEGNLAGILQLHRIQNLERITFRNFACNGNKDDMTRLAMKELIGSLFIGQNPHVQVDYKIPMADSILEMIDSSYVPFSTALAQKFPKPLRKELENALPEDSFSQQAFMPQFAATQANFCAVNWLGPPPKVQRDWSREVAIIMDELREKPNLIHAVKSILKNEEARVHLTSIDLNATALSHLVELTSSEIEEFENNHIEHIHFKQIQALPSNSLNKLESLFKTFRNLLTITFDSKLLIRSNKGGRVVENARLLGSTGESSGIIKARNVASKISGGKLEGINSKASSAFTSGAGAPPPPPPPPSAPMQIGSIPPPPPPQSSIKQSTQPPPPPPSQGGLFGYKKDTVSMNVNSMNVENSPNCVFFMLASATQNVDVMDQIIRRFSGELSKKNLETLKHNQLINHLTHISFKNNKNFEISAVKQKSMRNRGRTKADSQSNNLFASIINNQTPQQSSNNLNSGGVTSHNLNSTYRSGTIGGMNSNQNFMLGSTNLNRAGETQNPMMSAGQSRIIQFDDRVDPSQRGLIASITASQRRNQLGPSINSSSIRSNSHDPLLKSRSTSQSHKLQYLTQKGYGQTGLTPGGMVADEMNSDNNQYYSTSKGRQGNGEDLDQLDSENVNEVEMNYESDIKKYEGFTEAEIENLIDEKYFAQYLNSLESLQSIDLSSSTIKHEHADTIKGFNRINQLVFVDFKSCPHLTRVQDLVSLLSEQIPPSFQFDRFLENLPFGEIKSRKQVKKLIESILKTPFFQTYVRFFRLTFFEKIHLKGAVECLKGAFDPILGSLERLHFNMSAFLQSLPQILKQQVGDELIEFMTKKYSPITYLQPEHYSQVHYALNLIVQQASIANEIRIMYLLNPRFQKCISATSFELIFESLIVDEKDLFQQQNSLVKMRKGFVRNYFNSVKKVLSIQGQIEDRQKEIQSLLSQKSEDRKSKLKIKDQAKIKAENLANQQKAAAEEKKRQEKLKKEQEAQEAKELKEQQAKQNLDEKDIVAAGPLGPPEITPKTEEEIKKELENEKKEQRRKQQSLYDLRLRMKARLEEQRKDGKIDEDEAEEMELFIKSDTQKNQPQSKSEQSNEKNKLPSSILKQSDRFFKPYEKNGKSKQLQSHKEYQNKEEQESMRLHEESYFESDNVSYQMPSQIHKGENKGKNTKQVEEIDDNDDDEEQKSNSSEVQRQNHDESNDSSNDDDDDEDVVRYPKWKLKPKPILSNITPNKRRESIEQATRFRGLKFNQQDLMLKKLAEDLNLPNDAGEAAQQQVNEQLVHNQTQIIVKTYKKMTKSDVELIDINKLKNSDKSLTTSKLTLLNEIRDLAETITSVNDHLLYLEHKRIQCQKQVKDSTILFEFFDSLNLAYNKYFNQQGLNKYITSYIHPWLNMNENFQEIQQNNYINMKIFTSKNAGKSLKIAAEGVKQQQQQKQQQQPQHKIQRLQSKKQMTISQTLPVQQQQQSKLFDSKNLKQTKTINGNKQAQPTNVGMMMHGDLAVTGNKRKDNERLNEQMEQMVRVNHGLDDAIIKNLTSIMQMKMEKIRKINLSGLNIGDAFAEQFSLVLSNQTKLRSLRQVKLYHNKRLSSFGLKFLFSSIVKRIPDGFHINISPSLYDFQCLKKSIFLLERELVMKLYRLSKSIHSDQKKQFDQKTAILDRFQKSTKNKPSSNSDALKQHDKSLVALTRSAQVIPTPMDQNQEERKEENRDDDSILTEQELKERVREALRNNNDAAVFSEDNSQSGNLSDNENQDESNSSYSSTKHKGKANHKTDDDDEEGDEEEEDNNDENMLVMLKQIDAKRNILDWNLLTYEGDLSKRLLDEFEAKHGAEGKNLLKQIVQLRIKYEKSLVQIKLQNLEDEEDDLTVIIQNLVNEGLYDTINYVSQRQWENNKLTLIVVAMLLLPFTIFHYFQVTTHNVQDWINSFQFDELINFSCFQVEYSAQLTKLVPATVGSQDFYFDEDVASLNTLLAAKTPEPNIRRQNLNILKKFLRDPTENRSLLDEIGTQQRQQQRPFSILKYSKWIFLLNFLLFQIGLCIIWPYFLVTNVNKESCKSIEWVYDIPFYVASIVLVVVEILMLLNLEATLSVKQIFSIKSALIVSLTYSSFMARYDQYTDTVFTFKTLTCEQLHDEEGVIKRIGVASLIIMSLNLFLQFLGFVWELALLFKNSIQSNSANSQELHNTHFINQFTKIALISEFYGIGISLDRFSTSSANDLNYWFIPSVLRNIKIPQIFQSKFQRVFVEDIPMIIILFIYNTLNLKSNWYEWDNLKVILTTLLNLHHSLSQAWIARPSVFRTYQMQEYLEFREEHQDIYRLKVTFKDKSSIFEYEEINKKIEEFLRMYSISGSSKSSSAAGQNKAISAGSVSNKDKSHMSVQHGQSEVSSLNDKSVHSKSEKENSVAAEDDEQSKNSKRSVEEPAERHNGDDDDEDEQGQKKNKAINIKKIKIEQKEDYKRKLYEFILDIENEPVEMKQAVLVQVPIFERPAKQRGSTNIKRGMSVTFQ